jgi:hypothetical protein
MNPKEVSYSHPQLPLCDTPICCHFRPFAGIETQKYRFFGKMQEVTHKNVVRLGLLFSLTTAQSSHSTSYGRSFLIGLHKVIICLEPVVSFFGFYIQ